MLIIGELINSSRAEIESAIKRKDGEFILKIAQEQIKAGAHYLDVNCATLLEEEPMYLTWLVKTIQEAIPNVSLSLDTPNPKAMEIALSVHSGKAILNSISLEKDRLAGMLPLIKQYKPSVIALCMDDRGLPQTALQEMEIATALVDKITEAGISPDDIYLDPLVRPISTDTKAGLLVLETIRLIKEKLPQVRIICGLSNVSFGLPKRRLLNRAFLIMCMTAGLDAVICDPLDQQLMSLIYSAKALLNQDTNCFTYITMNRLKKLVD